MPAKPRGRVLLWRFAKLDGTLPVRLGEGSAGGLSPDGKWAISISTGQPQHVTLLPIGAGQPRDVNISGLGTYSKRMGPLSGGWTTIITNGNEQGHATRCYVLSLSGGNAESGYSRKELCAARRHLTADSWLELDRTHPSPSTRSATDRPVRFPNSQAGFLPVQWSSDGSALYGYHAGELPSRIYKLEIATGQADHRAGVEARGSGRSCDGCSGVVSRDGTRFAYSYNQTLSVLYLISGLQYGSQTQFSIQRPCEISRDIVEENRCRRLPSPSLCDSGAIVFRDKPDRLPAPDKP